MDTWGQTGTCRDPSSKTTVPENTAHRGRGATLNSNITYQKLQRQSTERQVRDSYLGTARGTEIRGKQPNTGFKGWLSSALNKREVEKWLRGSKKS